MDQPIRLRPMLVVLFAFLPLALVADDRADFAKWWPQFQAAVAKGDAQAVAAGAEFPMHWENGKTREITSEAQFVKGFSSYFTAEIRKQVASKKPERYPNGNFNITWNARGNEYTIYFKPGKNGSFALDGLSEGPQ